MYARTLHTHALMQTQTHACAQRVVQAASMVKEGQIQEALVVYQKALDLHDRLHGSER